MDPWNPGMTQISLEGTPQKKKNTKFLAICVFSNQNSVIKGFQVYTYTCLTCLPTYFSGSLFTSYWFLSCLLHRAFNVLDYLLVLLLSLICFVIGVYIYMCVFINYIHTCVIPAYTYIYI